LDLNLLAILVLLLLIAVFLLLRRGANKRPTQDRNGWSGFPNRHSPPTPLPSCATACSPSSQPSDREKTQRFGRNVRSRTRARSQQTMCAPSSKPSKQGSPHGMPGNPRSLSGSNLAQAQTVKILVQKPEVLSRPRNAAKNRQSESQNVQGPNERAPSTRPCLPSPSRGASAIASTCGSSPNNRA
jgi:hypothetical protein